MRPFDYDPDGYDSSLPQLEARLPTVRWGEPQNDAGFVGQEVRGSPRKTSRRCQATKAGLGNCESSCG